MFRIVDLFIINPVLLILPQPVSLARASPWHDTSHATHSFSIRKEEKEVKDEKE